MEEGLGRMSERQVNIALQDHWTLYMRDMHREVWLATHPVEGEAHMNVKRERALKILEGALEYNA